jgi:hypothetical protein
VHDTQLVAVVDNLHHLPEYMRCLHKEQQKH